MKGVSGGWYPVPMEGADPPPPKTTTTEKVVLGGLGLALLGGIASVFGGSKKTGTKPSLGKGCGSCGR
jgi:hypothetical protein